MQNFRNPNSLIEKSNANFTQGISKSKIKEEKIKAEILHLDHCHLLYKQLKYTSGVE